MVMKIDQEGVEQRVACALVTARAIIRAAQETEPERAQQEFLALEKYLEGRPKALLLLTLVAVSTDLVSSVFRDVPPPIETNQMDAAAVVSVLAAQAAAWAEETRESLRDMPPVGPPQ